MFWRWLVETLPRSCCGGHITPSEVGHSDTAKLGTQANGEEPMSEVPLERLPTKKGLFSDESSSLSWASLMPLPLRFSVRHNHIHYRLCREAREALETEFPPAALDCTFLSALRPLAQWPPAIAKLVNLLANEYCINDDTVETFAYTPTLSCTLSFLIYGMLAVVAVNRSVRGQNGHYHVTCTTLREESPGTPDPSKVYAAAMLDILTALWEKECALRRRAKWSPMPWTRNASQYGETFPEPNIKPGSIKALALSSRLASLDDDHIVFRVGRSMYGNPIDIPLLGARHDGYPFSSTLNGYAKQRWRGESATTYDDVALWVNTMTFGLLEAVLQIKIPEAELLLTDPSTGKAILEGRRISRLIFKWQMYWATRLNTAAYVSQGTIVARLLHHALLAIDEEGRKDYSMGERAGFDYEKVQDIICAVTLTITTLCAVACSIWGDVSDEIRGLAEAQIFDTSRYFHFFTDLSCQRKLLAAGWCPATVSLTFLNFMSRPILSNLIRLKPYTRLSADEHRACTEDACTLYTVTDSDTYEARHVEPNCPCGAMSKTKPPDGQVEQLLSQGIIPVVQYNGRQLTVHRATDVPYIAISHVWAEGLGSTTEVGLPICQVDRLASLAARLLPEHGGAFWLDSLCIPSNKPYRKQAIQLMADTYRGADIVLVIDEAIRTLCSRKQPWETNILRIAASAWVHRVWTLQEALLAHRLVFEFADGLVDADTELANCEPFPPLYYDQHLPVLAARRVRSHSKELTPSTSASSRTRLASAHDYTLGEVISLLRHRKTSHRADETIAIAALLPAVKPAALLAITGPDADVQRLKLFFCQLGKLPRRFPVLPVPKLDLPCFRWAPRGIAATLESVDDRFGSASCDECGLHAEYAMGCLREPVSVPPECLKDEGADVSFEFTLVHEATASTYKANFYIGCHSLSTARELATIDALLFIDDKFPEDARYILFAAVRRRPEQEPGSCRPLHCDFVAPGRLHRLTYRPAVALAEGCPSMQKLENTQVILT